MAVAELERPNIRVADPVAQLTALEKARAAVHADIDRELNDGAVYDINVEQALILARLGKKELTVGALITSDAYLSSNVSYNVKKLVGARYLTREANAHDRRSSKVKCTPSGLEVAAIVRTAVARSQSLASVRVLG